jgi:hypothetical protein
MLRPCWVIFRENSLLHCWMHLYSVSENVPLQSKVYKCIQQCNRLFSLKMTQQVRNMWGVFTNKDCMYFGALVGEYYFTFCLLFKIFFLYKILL